MSLNIVDGRIQYVCSHCGADGVKLWREYSAFLNHQSLYCVVCACKDQTRDDYKPNPLQFNSEGQHQCVFGRSDGSECDCGWVDPIGFLVPAVPTEEGDTFWGYTSVPEPLVQWWRQLPTHPSYIAEGER